MPTNVLFHAITFQEILKEQTIRQKIGEFWPKLRVGYCPKKEVFTKVDKHCLDLTIVYHHAMSFQKHCYKADHENKVS